MDAVGALYELEDWVQTGLAVVQTYELSAEEAEPGVLCFRIQVVKRY